MYVLMVGGGVHALAADDGTVQWETATGATGRPDEDDSMPGFTVGVGVIGVAVTLEWLRRKADANDPVGVDD